MATLDAEQAAFEAANELHAQGLAPSPWEPKMHFPKTKTKARVWLFPYCLKRQEDGRYIVLNRNYKPLGFFTRDFLDYGDSPIAINLKMTRQRAAALSHEGKTDLDVIHLYADACSPTLSAAHWDAYARRLKVLCSITVEGDAPTKKHVNPAPNSIL